MKIIASSVELSSDIADGEGEFASLLQNDEYHIGEELLDNIDGTFFYN